MKALFLGDSQFHLIVIRKSGQSIDEVQSSFTYCIYIYLYKPLVTNFLVCSLWFTHEESIWSFFLSLWLGCKNTVYNNRVIAVSRFFTKHIPSNKTLDGKMYVHFRIKSYSAGILSILLVFLNVDFSTSVCRCINSIIVSVIAMYTYTVYIFGDSLYAVCVFMLTCQLVLADH